MYNGYEKINLYGAEFKEIQDMTPYYERVISTIDQKPWLAMDWEKDYLNNFKRYNEPPVRSYRELLMSPIDQNIHELIEGFENTDNSWFKIIFIIFILGFALYVLTELC